jgi:hypothetical protein
MTGTRKGKHTELFMADQLAAIMPDAQISHIGNVAHQTDIIISLPSVGNRTVSILLESKNYTQAVPKQELTKFFDDMISCRDRLDVQFGIFIAVGARIQGKRAIDV